MNAIILLINFLIWCVMKTQPSILTAENVLRSPTIFANKIKGYVHQNQNISKNCSRKLLQYVNDLQNNERWALKMFEASAKIPSSILEENFLDLGSFAECINTQRNDIYGQYCISSLQTKIIMNKNKSENNKIFVPKLLSPTTLFGINLGVCFPSACQDTDIEHVFSSIGIDVDVLQNTCQTKNDKTGPEFETVLVLLFFGFVFFWILISTAYDAVIQHFHKVQMHFLLVSFSILSNGKKLFVIKESADEITCLNGIRVISTMWVILAHTFSLYNRVNSETSMSIINAPLLVDTFLLISGITTSYVFMICSRKGVQFNILLFYIHRYIRLTPSLAVMILIYIYIANYIGSGPLWYTVNDFTVVACKENWWKALLYIQNYGNITKTCVPQSWYLSVDMQLFVFSPILLIPLLHWPSITLLFTGFLALCSMAASFLITWSYKLNITTFTFDEYTYMQYYYMATHTRAAPWLLGVIMGYIIYNNQKRATKIVLNNVLVLILWIIALTVLSVCVFCGHDLILGTDVFKKSLYNALVRPIWALALCWIISACHFGRGGIINWFLSLKVFKFVSQFTYALYLTHYLILTVKTANIKTTSELNKAFELENIWMCYMLTLFASIVLTLIFECPIIAFEKVLFKKSEKRKKIQ